MLRERSDVGFVARFRDTYLSQWSKGVAPIAGVAALLSELASSFTLVLATNTHHPGLVHEQLRALGAGHHFANVVTSVEHGKRKPSACIFNRALALVWTAGDEHYIGDSFAADYVGATNAGIRCLLIEPERRYDIPDRNRLAHILDAQRRLHER